MRVAQWAARRVLARLQHTRASAASESDIYLKADSGGSIVGSVVAAAIEGKGRGVIARSNIAASDLLLWAQPAVVIEGPPDGRPDPSLLVQALLRAANAADGAHIAAALDALYDGTGGPEQQLPDLRRMMDPAAAAGGGCCSHGHGHEHEHAQPPCRHGAAGVGWEARLSEQRAERLVRLNAFGDEYDDLASAALRGVDPRSCVGVWPQFALFNHSCLSNAVHYAVGRALVVRAVQDVPAGEELTVSYLGREEFAPASVRQAVLEERFGFACSCERCTLEQRAPPQLQRLLGDIYERVAQDLRPAFVEAVERQDEPALARVQRQLLAQEDTLSAALQAYRPALSDGAVLVLQGAVYDLYEALLFSEQLLGGPAAAPGAGGAAARTAGEVRHAVLGRLGRCVTILNTVSRGAELHLYLAARLLHHAEQLRGADSAQAEAAAALLLEAHRLRYGDQLGGDLASQLLEASKQVAREFFV